MAAALFRLGLLTIGMAAVELGLGEALVKSSIIGWGLVFLLGAPFIVAGSAGFIAPLLGGPHQKGSLDA